MKKFFVYSFSSIFLRSNGLFYWWCRHVGLPLKNKFYFYGHIEIFASLFFVNTKAPEIFFQTFFLVSHVAAWNVFSKLFWPSLTPRQSTAWLKLNRLKFSRRTKENKFFFLHLKALIYSFVYVDLAFIGLLYDIWY